MNLIPLEPEGLTPAVLTELASALYPDIEIRDAQVTEIKRYGEPMVSSSMRISLDVEYAGPYSSSLPTRIMAKMSAPEDVWCAQLDALYENEVNFYTRVRPAIELETPITIGGLFDPETKRYILLIEDIRAKGGRPNLLMHELSAEEVQGILDTHARLHATFWESPRFQHDLNWVQTHLHGSVEDLMHGVIRDEIKHHIDEYKFRREILGQLGASEAEMYAGIVALKQHQSKLSQTLLHGDSHVGNSYTAPGSVGGLYDFQLSVRGYLMHDVAYMIATALTIEQRRKHERELLRFYQDRLSAYGVKNPPSFDELLLEYRRSQLWNFYLGWLPAPEVNYGWQMMVVAHQRTAAAMEDHETMKVIKELM